jgi:ATP-dependent DNA helicase DinG
MNDDLASRLMDWLLELNLPEPEIAYQIAIGGQDLLLSIAYPDPRLGLLAADDQAGIIQSEGWTIWRYTNLEEAHAALVALGQRLGSSPTLGRLSFDRVSDLFARELLDMAREELDRLQASIDAGHPDWDGCEEWGSKIRKEQRKARRAKPPHVPQAGPTQVSVAQLLKADVARTRSGDLPPHNLLGLFTPVEQVEMSAVDAVWMAHIGPERSSVWPATVKGHPTYESDPAWELLETDSDLLNGMLQRVGGLTTFVWDAEQAMPLLEAWHFRAIGNSLPQSLPFVDLRALCLIAFPTVQRVDRPESLCQELNLAFRDEMGNGGALAAMEALLQACAQELRSLNDPLRAALRHVLSRTALPTSGWLDILLPPPPMAGFAGYLEALADYYDSFPAPLQSSSGQREVAGLSVDQFFQVGGFLAQAAGDRYRVRDGQIEFTRSVAEAVQTTTPHVLEAGTGVGKTIGYLVPLLLSGKRCYVATHTRNLQDQAWSKDVPLVLQAFQKAGIGRSVAIIKGKSNYACIQTVADWLDDLDEIIQSAEDSFALAGILHWLLLTKTGWLSEIESLGQPALIGRLGRDQAPPTLSETWASRDPHARAREAAKAADLVLVNHSFVFALAKHQAPGEAEVEIVLFDEAHNIEQVVTEALTLDFVPWSLQSEIASLLKRDDKGQVRGLLRVVLEHPDVDRVAELSGFRDALLPLEQMLASWCEACSLRLADMCEGNSDYDPDTPVLFPMADFWVTSLRQPAHTLLGQLQVLSLATETLLEKLPYLRGLPRRLSSSLGTLHQHIEENAEALGTLLASDAEDQIRWGEARVRLDEQGVPYMMANRVEWRGVFHSSPLDVATWLRGTLHPLYTHRIYVSATLAVGGSFSSILNRLGLVDGAQASEPVTKICPSPFNFREQVLLAVPSDAPDPRTSTDPLYLEVLSTNIADLARAAGGQTLVLFTSRRTMRQVVPRLQARLRDENIVVLAQSATNRAALVERFRAAPQQGEKIVLLGLRASWEGIDVPGEALTILVVSRLPFDYAGHPIAVARKRHYLSQGFDRDYFREVVVPATFLYLRQMYGRLIRKEDDRGICVIMDPRIYLKRYGKYLLKRLPESATVVAPSPVVLDHARQFLRGEPAPSDLFDWGELPYIAHDLSPEQKAIVQSQAQCILVRAAAGSGKTYVLVERLMRLVESGEARPDQVLALTFTNKAMNVMIERLCDRLGDRGYDLARNVLTYHKFAARILRHDAWETGQEVVFLDENDPELQGSLLDHARKMAGLTERELPDEDALTVVAYAQNGLINEEELEQALPELQRNDPYTAKLARFFLSYVGQLREKGLMDYGEAIVGAVRILRTDARAKQMWSGRFKWIFCDEYQDTTPAQATLLSLIGQHAYLFVVGDSAQSIYSWQGADPDNLRRFEIDFPNTATYPLYKNYRCFPNLIRVSSRFLERCGQAHGIRITYDERRSTETQSVYYLASQDDREEAGAIAVLARDALALEIPGDPPRTGTVGVLARKWWLLSTLETELIRQEVPYRFEGETARGLSARPDVRRVIERAVDLLRLAAFGQPMGESPDGRAVADIRAGHLALADRLLDRAQQVLGSVLSPEARADYGQLRAALKDKPAGVLTKLYGAGPDQPALVLSTVHSQKGEEFDTVFVLGLEKGNSPHTPPVRHTQIVEWRKAVQRLSHATWRAPLTDEDLQQLYEEEEQRIFYVAMTRARHNLVVGHATRRNQRPYAQSEFLERARVQDAVREVAEGYDITLTKPEAPASVPDYRSDGRLYETNAGFRVRSKSEMLLANEFTQRGMYFEYEEPSDDALPALPDFSFPDYGGVVLEHLGLLTDADYLARWEEKAAAYERQGIRYFRTTEEEIQQLAATVSRLRDQFRAWAEQRYGSERVRLIDLVERVRRDGDLQIGRSVGDFENGIFEAASASDMAVVAVAITMDGERSPIPPEMPEVLETPGVVDVMWQEQPVAGICVWVGRTT